MSELTPFQHNQITLMERVTRFLASVDPADAEILLSDIPADQRTAIMKIMEASRAAVAEENIRS
jgi:hypothetical protein